MRESVAHPNRRADCQRVLIEVEGPVDLERHVGSHDAEHLPLVAGPHSATGITPLGKLHSGTPRIWRRVGSVGSGCSSGSFDSIEPVTFLSLLSANTVAASAAAGLLDRADGLRERVDDVECATGVHGLAPAPMSEASPSGPLGVLAANHIWSILRAMQLTSPSAYVNRRDILRRSKNRWRVPPAPPAARGATQNATTPLLAGPRGGCPWSGTNCVGSPNNVCPSEAWSAREHVS